MFVSVMLLSPPYATLTYSVPEYFACFSWQAGLRVLVPLGNGYRVGVVDGLHEQADVPSRVRIKNILWPLESTALISCLQLSLVREMAIRQVTQAGRIVAAMLPAGLRTGPWRLRVLADGKRPTVYGTRALAEVDSDLRVSIIEAFLVGQAVWQVSYKEAAKQEVCVLMADPPWSIRPAATKQRAVLELLLREGVLSRAVLVARLGSSSTPSLMQLVEQGLVSIRRTSDMDDALEASATLMPPLSSHWQLSTAQKKASEHCIACLDTGTASSCLLHGVTGSGKTAVYMEVAKACLERGKSVLLLAPEVALALKLFRDVGGALPEAPRILYHGYQSSPLRERLFLELAQSEKPSVVIGTRSALFLPIPQLGLIILDEEHDASFKQDEGLTYQAKEIAWFRALQVQGLLLLGSATPDIKTFYAAETGRIPVLSLPHRVGGGTLPPIDLVNLNAHNVHDQILSPASLDALHETLDRGEQAVMLLNRRGYAPLMYCLDCGKAERCPHCDIALSYHKGRESLLCHYCGYFVAFPCLCSQCQSTNFFPMGQGTERLEEQIASILPAGGRVLRLDRDSTRRPGSMEAVLQSFAAGEAQVLVGTQMLSKGHHFPDVTLAIVADGDMGLNIPDYRAAERTFQLLIQAAGRAGRSVKKGRVIIQSRDTNHYCWRFIQQADYQGFYEHELALRKLRKYPPFICLALIRFSWPINWKQGARHVEELGKVLRKLGREHGVTLLGPAPAPLTVLRGRVRWQALLKAQTWPLIRMLFSAVQDLPQGECRVTLDIDPVNML